MGITLGRYGDTSSAGWTVVSSSVDTVVYYVSTSDGNDSNNGLSSVANFSNTGGAGAAGPVRSLNKLVQLMEAQSGTPVWGLLKAGDTWTNEYFGNGGGANVSLAGRSATEPALFGSYGTGARPKIIPPDAANGGGSPRDGMLFSGGGNSTGLAQTNGNFIAVIGLNFYSQYRDPNFMGTLDNSTVINPAGISTNSNRMQWLLVEDCRFSYFHSGIVMDTRPDISANAGKIIVRRNIFDHIWGYENGHSQCIYIDFAQGPLIEENIGYKHNNVPSVTGLFPNVHAHFHYVNESNISGMVSRGNIILDGNSSCDFLCRCGGTLDNNLSYSTGFGLSVWGHGNIDNTTVTAITNNVVLDTIGYTDPDFGNTGVTGFTLDNGGGTATNNIVANTQDTGIGGAAIDINSSFAIGWSITGNIVKGYTPVSAFVDNGVSTITTPNQIEQGGYANSSVTIADYMTSIGGTASMDGFGAALLGQSKAGWDARLMASNVNNYFRAAFNMAAVGVGLVVHPMLALRARTHA